MSLITSGIEKVRAFELPAGIWEDGEYAGTPRTALVKWRSKYSDMFYQVYVNRQLAGVTVDSYQRKIVVRIPTSFESPVRIEVFAVRAEDAHIDFSGELDTSLINSGRVKINLLRSQNHPIGAMVQVYFDNGTGQVDYEEQINPSPIKIWPAWQDKAGFGMSQFGASDFGYDGAAAIGFGKGSFGHGRFGLDADTFDWTSATLDAGVYKFGVRIIDENGNVSAASETEPVTVTPASRPAEKLIVGSFDKQTNQLELNIQ